MIDNCMIILYKAAKNLKEGKKNGYKYSQDSTSGDDCP